MISIIVAMDKNGLIGCNGKLPWAGQLQDDMKHFRDTTIGHTVIMGRKTFESIGKPLDKRINIIVSKTYQSSNIDNIIVYRDIDTILEIDSSTILRNTEKFVIGGAEIYKQFLPYAQRLYITRIDAEFEGDIYFPRINYNDWNLVSVTKGIVNNRNLYPHRFEVWERI